MKVICIDPGVTTGYVLANIHFKEVDVRANQERLSHKGLWNLLLTYKPHHIVYEGFEYRPRLGAAELFPRELIGVIRLYAEFYNCGSKEQKPSTGIGGFYKKKEKLMEKDLWVKGCPHGMDAMRHFLYWFNFGHGSQYNIAHKIVLVEHAVPYS